jgi:lipase maturation factor 1
MFLRALGLIFGSAFYSLLHQIHGLIGPRGILPIGSYLDALSRAASPAVRLWAAPTVLWASAGDGALTALVGTGLVASVLLTVNIWPRMTTAICTLAFLSCVAALQDFSAYQSDGMLLQAGVASILLAPRGLRPGLGAASPPTRAAVWLLRWEWFAIYFESGVVKLMSGDVQWKTLTAMDHYYENNPLPTWIGWYAEQMPHVVHAATVLLTFVVELGAPWVVLAGRRTRLTAAVLLTLFQAGIIATANYAFLNYLVLSLGVFLVDDRALVGLAHAAARRAPRAQRMATAISAPFVARAFVARAPRSPSRPRVGWNGPLGVVALVATLYVSATSFLVAWMPAQLATPARFLAPFRIANAYGLFAVMTTARYEIEFQGTRDERTWIAYPFRYKPQDPAAPPGIYAPYQPRFEWNLWFASLGSWTETPWVVATQVRLLDGEPSVLSLFAANPFASAPPVAVRSVLWRYWFTDVATRRRTGRWWDREELGLYAGTVRRQSDGALHFQAAQEPQ